MSVANIVVESSEFQMYKSPTIKGVMTHELPLFFILYCFLRSTYNVIIFTPKKEKHNLE